MEKKRNLSQYKEEEIPFSDDKHHTIAIVVAEWNSEITYSMKDACIDTLLQHGVKRNQIIVKQVAGSFELPFVAKQVILHQNADAVICIGCIIQGETRHFDFIAQATANGIMNVGLECNVPVIFGVLTTNNMQQAIDRAGGKHGNKGTEAAVTCLKMLSL